jgi:uncharacterized protein YceK
MRKAVLVVIVLAIVLILSSCATLMSLLDMKSVDNYNKELMGLSDENKEIVKEIGLTEKAPAINLGLAVLVDAWALSPAIMFVAYSGGETQLPAWASILTLTGIFGGTPASLVCSGISFASSFKVSPLAEIEQYEAKKLKEEVKKKLEDTVKETEQDFLKDPTQCPLVIEKIDVLPESYHYKIALTIRNISPWKITAIKVRISGWSIFGDRLFLATGSEDITGLSQNLYFSPGSSREFEWETYADGLYRAEAEILQVMYSDGMQWPMK